MSEPGTLPSGDWWVRVSRSGPKTGRRVHGTTLEAERGLADAVGSAAGLPPGEVGIVDGLGDAAFLLVSGVSEDAARAVAAAAGRVDPRLGLSAGNGTGGRSVAGRLVAVAISAAFAAVMWAMASGPDGDMIRVIAGFSLVAGVAGALGGRPRGSAVAYAGVLPRVPPGVPYDPPSTPGLPAGDRSVVVEEGPERTPRRDAWRHALHGSPDFAEVPIEEARQKVRLSLDYPGGGHAPETALADAVAHAAGLPTGTLNLDPHLFIARFVLVSSVSEAAAVEIAHRAERAGFSATVEGRQEEPALYGRDLDRHFTDAYIRQQMERGAAAT